MTKQQYTILSSLIYLLATFSISAKESEKLIMLADWMQGSFNSSQQAEQNEQFFNIHLHMKQIWPAQKGAIWLYVEQAADGYLDRPYRQRVYEVKQLEEDKFVSIVYTFPEPLSYAGDWKKDNPLIDLKPEALEIRKGCAVYLSWDSSNQAFTGETDAKSCESTLRGATYATSEVEVYKDRIVSWDRGYDANDVQVWGAEVGGYIFIKQ